MLWRNLFKRGHRVTADQELEVSRDAIPSSMGRYQFIGAGYEYDNEGKLVPIGRRRLLPDYERPPVYELTSFGTGRMGWHRHDARTEPCPKCASDYWEGWNHDAIMNSGNSFLINVLGSEWNPFAKHTCGKANGPEPEYCI